MVYFDLKKLIYIFDSFRYIIRACVVIENVSYFPKLICHEHNQTETLNFPRISVKCSSIESQYMIPFLRCSSETQ